MSIPFRPLPHTHSHGPSPSSPSPSSSSSRYRKTLIVVLTLITLFLIGTVVVLSSVSHFYRFPAGAVLTEDEVRWIPDDRIRHLRDEPVSTLITRQVGDAEEEEAKMEEMDESMWEEVEKLAEEMDMAEEEEANYESELEAGLGVGTADDWVDEGGEWGVDGKGSGGYWMQKGWDGRVAGTDGWERLDNVTARHGERIPRLIHQTWKSDVLPEKWRKAWKECREGMPDYEYMLWTDTTSREFISTYYPSYLQMYDSYKYPIQRADSIRYFVLHHFGGVYMDLDIGCRRRLDPLLQGDWDVVLPVTKPVGVSNDLIFSSKGSAFMDDTVHGLPAWNHEWVTNYPTVMFSTGPMFLSSQYAIYSSAHPLTSTHPRYDVRILPKSLYGKNALEETVPHSFFSHFYGSSWHADDAGFIAFLATWGKKCMWLAGALVLLATARLVYLRIKGKKGGMGSQQYQLLSISPSSPTASSSSSANEGFEPLHLPQQLPSEIASAFRRAGNLILAAPATLLSGDRRSGRRRTGLLYFVPALFQPGPSGGGRARPRTMSDAPLPLRRSRREANQPPPPPYEGGGSAAEGGAQRQPGEGMEEVDKFLREEGAEDDEGEGEDGHDEGEGEGEGEWAEWRDEAK